MQIIKRSEKIYKQKKKIVNSHYYEFDGNYGGFDSIFHSFRFIFHRFMWQMKLMMKLEWKMEHNSFGLKSIFNLFHFKF